MDENNFTIGGISYSAVEKAYSMSRCRYCSFEKDLQCIDDKGIPPCDRRYRTDNRDVVYVEGDL